MNNSVKMLFAGSIVVNVLLSGMILGDIYRRYCYHAPFDVSSALTQLPPEKRALFETVMGPAKEHMDAEHSQIDEGKKEAMRLLKAEPFNQEAYLTQVRHIEDMHQQMKRHMAEAVTTLAKQFTPSERAILAEIISHPPFALPPGSMPGRPATTTL